jgi:tetratricopeptide (TPR) repeat protein
MVGESETDREWDFFVSYTAADRGWAEWIAWQLEEAGYRALIQAWDMVPGANWPYLLQEGTRKAARTVAVLSGAYLKSVVGTAEWEAAWQVDPLGKNRKLLVFRVADCERPGLLGGVVSVDLFDTDRSAARARVRAAVQGAVVGRAKPESEPDFPIAGRAGEAARAEPRFPGTLPEIWNVPPRNPNFAGRAAQLERIRTLVGGHPAVTVHALHGMGGIGKTQAAIEYAYRYAADYDLVWWINAEQAALIGDQFAALAAELGLPPLADPEATAVAVRRALRRRDRWLLIFDNAEDAEQISPLLPGGAGHALITTRRGGFRSLGGVLDLETLDRPDAIALLRRQAPDLTDEGADHLAARLGDLPLALAQSAAYLDQTGMPPGEYLRLLETRADELHGRGHAPGHPGTVATVWLVSLDRLRTVAPAGVQLLELCAWLSPEPIPLDLFTDHCDQLPEPLATAAGDPVAFNDAVGALADYSLARRSGDTIIVHRLIQDVARRRPIDPAAAGTPLATVLELLRADLPSTVWSTPESWPRWRTLLPSVLAATGHHADTGGEGPAPRLLGQAGTYLRSLGRFAEALPLYERALRIEEAVLGPDHTDVASALNEVGRVLSDLGRAAEALPLQERALRIDEAALGPNHPSVATDLNEVGRALRDLGRVAEALPLQERALRIDEAAQGPDHGDVATDLNEVGWVLLDLGRAAEALPLQERALRIDEAAFGPDHSYVATDLASMGRALRDLGRVAEALPLHERALRIHEAAFGPDHPYVANDLNHVGLALSALGRSAEALSLQERALRIDEAALGPGHPSVAADLNQVGLVLSELDRSAEALPLHMRAMRIYEAALGQDHPSTRRSRRFVSEIERSG